MMLLPLATIPAASWRYRYDMTKFKRKRGNCKATAIALNAVTMRIVLPNDARQARL